MDINAEIEKVRRSVVNENHASKRVILTRRYDTSVEDLWEACTSPARLARWFEPVNGDLSTGGRYTLGGSGTTGEIRRCEPPSTLEVTWEYEGDTSEVELRLSNLEGVEGMVELRLEHRISADEHWQTYGPGAVGAGWDGSFLALDMHLAGDRRAEPEQMAKFDASPTGRAFTVSSVEAWRAAHVLSGASEELARVSGERTVGFYLGTGDRPSG